MPNREWGGEGITSLPWRSLISNDVIELGLGSESDRAATVTSE